MNPVILFIAVISTIICFIYNTNIHYSLIALLPFSFLVFSCLGHKLLRNLKQSYVFYIFYIQAVIRYCLIPVGVSFGNYLGNGSYSQNGNIAILFMIVELITIFALFIYQNNKFKYINKSTNIVFVSKNYWLYFFVIVMFFIILMSGFFAHVSAIWNLQEYVHKVLIDREEIEVSSIGGLLFTPFKIAILLIFSSSILKSKIFNEKLKVVSLLILIVLAGSFIVGVSRFSIVMFILPFYFLIIDLFERRNIKVFTWGLVAILSFIIIVTSVYKYTRGDYEIGISDIIDTNSLNAYFAGPGNIAAGIDAFEDVSEKNYGLYFLNDLFQNVPLLSKLTNDAYKSNFIYNKSIYGHSLYRDQIVPLSIAGIFHFDLFGISIYSILFLSIAFYYEKKGRKEEYLPYKYVYFVIMFTLSLVFMLNIGSMVSSFIRTFVFTFTPFYISNKLNKIRFTRLQRV